MGSTNVAASDEEVEGLQPTNQKQEGKESIDDLSLVVRLGPISIPQLVNPPDSGELGRGGTL